MKVIKVGIIDDDGSKVTQMMAYLLYGMKDASKMHQNKRLIGTQMSDLKCSKFRCLLI